MRQKKVDRRAYLARLCRTVPYSYVEAVLEHPSEAGGNVGNGSRLSQVIVDCRALLDKAPHAYRYALRHWLQHRRTLVTKLLGEHLRENPSYPGVPPRCVPL